MKSKSSKQSQDYKNLNSSFNRISCRNKQDSISGFNKNYNAQSSEFILCVFKTPNNRLKN